MGTINITYDMEFIISKNSKYYLQKHFDAIILYITNHCLKIHYKYLSKSKISINNKSSRGMKTHGNMCHWCPFCRFKYVIKRE